MTTEELRGRAQLRKQVEGLHDGLKKLEWCAVVDGWEDYCPACTQNKMRGHSGDCWLAALLAEPVEAGAGQCECDSTKGVICDEHNPIMKSAEKSLIQEPPAGEPRLFEQWWMDWRYKNPKEEAAWAAKAAWNAALATREAGKESK